MAKVLTMDAAAADIIEGTALLARGIKRVLVDAGSGAVEWGIEQYEQSKIQRQLNVEQQLLTFLEKQTKDDIISKEYRVLLTKLQNIIQNDTNNRRQSIIKDNALSIYKDAILRNDDSEFTIIKKLCSLCVFEYTGNGQRVPEDVVSVVFHPSIIEVKNCKFSGCKSLKEVVFNEGLKEIGGYAFMNCISLGSINSPSTLTEIGNYAFYNCRNLREVLFNDGLKQILDYAFYGCSSLQSITLPSTLTDIGDHAFNTCSNLREVVIMNDKTKIGNNTFTCCEALESYKFPNLSRRLETLVRVGYYSDIVNKINKLPGVHWRGGQIFIPAYMTIFPSYGKLQKVPHGWVTIRSKLAMVVELLACYEKKEAITLLELALWKANMNQEVHPINREAYRVEMPGPVKDAIFTYLS